MKTVEIFCIGTELLSFNKTDTNSLWLAEKLESMGFCVIAKHIVKDDVNLLQRLIRQELHNTDIIITIGGLGPTQDDVTRQAVCQAINKKLVFTENIWESIQQRFMQRKRSIPDITKVQAYIPEGSDYFLNKVGSAPGTWTSYQNNIIIMLPGPPSEMIPMCENDIIPELEKLAEEPKPARLYYGTAGLPESLVEEKLFPFYQKFNQLQVTLLASPGQVDIYILIINENASIRETLIQEADKEIMLILKDYIYTRNEKSLEEVAGELLTLKRKTLAIAESCTGGLLGNRITNISGSSEYFERGIISYSNESKIELL